jgi:hypothetical protein
MCPTPLRPSFLSLALLYTIWKWSLCYFRELQDTQWYLARAASLGHPKKQTATALSTGEAEDYAVTHAGRVVIWLRQLLTEIGFAPHIGTTLTH